MNVAILQLFGRPDGNLNRTKRDQCPAWLANVGWRRRGTAAASAPSPVSWAARAVSAAKEPRVVSAASEPASLPLPARAGGLHRPQT